MKKVVTVVGARPQFIKAAVVSRELRKEYHEVMIHTGQHYDYNMSDIFFQELDIPKPDYNLGISGGSHGKMTGEMVIEIEKVLMKEKPDIVLLYGDTNSTMAAAIVAVKLQIPIVHVEAGNRFGTLHSPEEVNRIVTDHVSDLLMCCTQSAKDFLDKEGLASKSFVVGDPMYDAFLFYSNSIGNKAPEQLKDIVSDQVILMPENWNYLTCHRQENTENPKNLLAILNAMEDLESPCIYPVHPRNHQMVVALQKEYSFKNILFVKPVGYLMSIYLVNHSNKIVTDSGGLQREAYFAKKQCVTVLDFVVWPETMNGMCNQLSKPDKNMILQKLNEDVVFDQLTNPFGDGQSARHIIELMKKCDL